MNDLTETSNDELGPETPRSNAEGLSEKLSAIGKSPTLNVADAKHLSPEARQWLFAKDCDRIARILSDVEIIHPILSGLLNEAHWLINRPRKIRARGIVICGEPGTGKTVLAGILQRMYPVDSWHPTEIGGGKRKVLTIDMTSARTTKAVLMRILQAISAPIPRSPSISDLEFLTIETLRRINCGLLVLDEVQDILKGPEREQLRVLEIIKLLMNKLKLPVLALGPETAGRAFQADIHMNKRFRILALPLWEVGDDLGLFLDAWESSVPLRRPSNLSSIGMQKVLVKISGGNLDTMLTRLCDVAVSAVLDGSERITQKLINAPHARPSIEALIPA